MVKIYKTSRMGNDGKKYVGVNINNRQFELPGKQISGVKTKAFAVPGFARAKSVTYNPNNYKKTPMTSNIYGNNDQKIKQTKSVVRDTPRKTVIKTTSYGPANYYGKQTKTTTKQVTRKR